MHEPPRVAPQTSRPALSPREQQILRHMTEGCTYAGTARRLGISVHTVDGYLRRIRAKTGVYTQAELIRLALMLGL
ncbi:response regulator transcription factor [Streptomyces sp. NPDC058676]|uniref:response regulator transcription factor n=1 Tax=unclassified Streptomyces TaxID=2593676 RepID=UPI00366454B9